MSKAKAFAGWRAIGFIAIAILVFLLHLPQTRDGLLFDDSADYMRAAQDLILSTWMDTDSASLPQLITLHQQNPEFRRHPWDFLYAAGDNSALRHFHSPLSFYAMHAVRALFEPDRIKPDRTNPDRTKPDRAGQDRAARRLASCVSAVTCGFLFYLLVQLGLPLAPAALLALFAGMQSRYIEVSIDPTPHGWYIFFALGFLYFFARFLISQLPRDLYVAAVTLALAFSALEFTVELLASVPLALALLWISNRGLLPRWSAVRRPLLHACGIFLVATFVIWPGGWIHGGFLVDYGELSATVLFKNKTAYGQPLSAGLIYSRLFAHNLVLLLLSVVWLLGGVWLLVRHRLSIAAALFSSYALFAFLLGVADHFNLFTYVSEFALFLIPSAGLILNDLLLEASTAPLRRGGFICAELLLALGCVLQWQQRYDGWAPRSWLQATIAGIPQYVPAGQTVLVSNNREALSLYLPAYRFEPTVSPESSAPRSVSRTANVHYLLLDNQAPPPLNARRVASFAGPPGHDELLYEDPGQTSVIP